MPICLRQCNKKNRLKYGKKHRNVFVFVGIDHFWKVSKHLFIYVFQKVISAMMIHFASKYGIILIYFLCLMFADVILNLIMIQKSISVSDEFVYILENWFDEPTVKKWRKNKRKKQKNYLIKCITRWSPNGTFENLIVGRFQCDWLDNFMII